VYVEERCPRIEKVNDRLFGGRSPIVPSDGERRGRGCRSLYRWGEDVVAEDFSIESFLRG
jgi:hypothetical protein